MNNFDDWTKVIAKCLKREADLLAVIDKDDLDDSAAQQAFIRAILEPFLPDSYAIGSGCIIDAFGHTTEKLDIIVYRRDFPKLNVAGSLPVYMFESVLAAFEVKTKLIRKSCFEALDHCASLASLKASVDQGLFNSVAAKNGLKRARNGEFVHANPLVTARFNLLSRPPVFIFGFSGMKTNYKQLQENIELWIEHRKEENISTTMKTLPAVFATQGCFATRNSAPFSTRYAFLMGVGADDMPFRFIISQLLYHFNRQLRTSANSFGVKPTLDAYLKQLPEPGIEAQIGKLNYNREVRQKSSARLGSKIPSTSATNAALAPKPERPVTPKTTAQFSQALKPDNSGAFAETIKQQAPTPITRSQPRQDQHGAFLQPMKSGSGEGEVDAESNPQHASADAFQQTVKLPTEKLNSTGSNQAADKAFEETVKLPAEQLNAESAAGSAQGSGFLNTIQQRMSEARTIREPFPDLQPASEPEPDPYTSTIPQ